MTTSLFDHVSTRLIGLAVPSRIEDDMLIMDLGEEQIRVRPDPEWESCFQKYRRLKTLSYDVATRTLVTHKFVELPLVRLDQNFYFDFDTALSDAQGNTLTISKCSPMYSMAHFDSSDYPKYFETVVKERLKRMQRARTHHLFLFLGKLTATYKNKASKRPNNFLQIAERKTKSSLLKLAVEQHFCLAVWSQKRAYAQFNSKLSDDLTISNREYDETTVAYYKTAKSSPFPSQSFLAYYHVLEYYFLRVAESLLHNRLKALVNDTKFNSSLAHLEKLISAIRGQDARNDETEMLRNVINTYVSEEDLIAFIHQTEESCGEKIYSKRREIFGEPIYISCNEKGHAVANAAKALKHIRNAIVHSSDRYTRSDRHIPLSDSEGVIHEYTPLIRFLAERVIYGTAT